MYEMFKQINLPETGEILGTGWLPSLPDLRDYTNEHPKVFKMTKELGMTSKKMSNAKLPEKVNLRKWCSEIENQGSLGSCTAHAAVGVIEYFENRAFGKFENGSRLFIYKTTRNLLGVSGDTGAWLRNTMGALVLCGCPPETYWPYTDKKPDFDKEPESFIYAIADNYEAISYFCHDPLGLNKRPENILLR